MSPVRQHNVTFALRAVFRQRRYIEISVTDIFPVQILQRQHLVAWLADRLLERNARHHRQRLIDDFHLFIGRQNHHAIDAVLHNHGQPTALCRQLLIEARVAHGNGRLVSEPLQKLPVQRRKGRVAPKKVDHAEQVLLEKQGQADHLSQLLAQRGFHFPYPALHILLVAITQRKNRRSGRPWLPAAGHRRLIRFFFRQTILRRQPG